MTLYQKLQQLGFTKVVTPITNTQRFLNRFYSTPKYVPTVHDYWVEKTINGVKYEVYEIDYWYTELRVNGEVIFDERRFADEELLTLIPIGVKIN